MCVCVCVCVCVCGSTVAQTDGSILIKFSTNDLTDIWEVCFSRILKCQNRDVMAAILIFLLKRSPPYWQKLPTDLADDVIDFEISKSGKKTTPQISVRSFVENFIKIHPSVWAVALSHTDTHTYSHTYIHTYTHPRFDRNIFSQND